MCRGKVVFLEIFVHWLTVQTTVCMIKKIFLQRQLQYHLCNVIGTVIKCQKGSESTGKIITPQNVVFLAVNIFAVRLQSYCVIRFNIRTRD